MSIHQGPCRVEQELRSFERQESARAARESIRENAIEERADQLLASDFCPWSQANILEAISEIDLVGENGKTVAELAKCMNHANWDRLGQIVGEGILAYWQKLARDKAEAEVDRAVAYGDLQ